MRSLYTCQLFCISQASLVDSPLNMSLAIADSALLLYFRLLLSVCPFITIFFLPYASTHFTLSPQHTMQLHKSLGAYSPSFIVPFLDWSSVTKEKNEDENYEYEMMWDAEGSMHLVKKVLQTPLKRQSDKSLVERGNAVMRSAARKIEVAMNSIVGGGVSDSLMRSASKSRTKLVIQRVIRTIMMIIVIAAFNVPIYMMLLFKDWIEQ